jgi:aryl-alcohol dehydrogenase-like predicted oxidoreductase
VRAALDEGITTFDTADAYAGGSAEEVLGRALKGERRQGLEILTKVYWPLGPGPNDRSLSRKHIMESIDGSLRRLQTDYVDVLYLHAWDGFTPVDEVIRALDDVVRQGKARYIALSDVPAWYASRAATLAECHGFVRPCALQLEYSLAERGIEYEFPSLCREIGAGIVVWSPLGSGVLSGKYRQDGASGRLAATAAMTPPGLAKLTPRNRDIVEELCAVAGELGCTPAQVAVAWVASRPAVGAVLLGARSEEQLSETLAALDVELPQELVARLDAVSAPALEKPYSWFGWGQGLMNGDMAARPQAYLA